MALSQKTHTQWLAGFLVLLIAVPLTLAADVSEQSLVDAKDQFTELWHSAAATTQRRAALEQTLAQFDDKVAEAKLDLEKASTERKAVRERILEQRAFIEALQGQMHAAAEAQAFYTALALSQRDDLVEFIRYSTSKDIALSQSGPALGGSILKHVLRGSLGDSIEDSLARDAVAQARARFFGQIHVLIDESGRIQERLLAMADEFDTQLLALEKEHENISAVVDEKQSFIDDSWKEKKLTEEELQHVAAEAAEAAEQVAKLQEDLVAINEELKQAKLKDLSEEKKTVEAEIAALEEEREVVRRKDEAMHLLEEAAVKALQQTVELKNTDKKLYKALELAELTRSNLSAQLTELQAAFGTGTIVPTDAMKKLSEDIAFLDEVIPFMKQGVPQAAAETYVRAKHDADFAAQERVALKVQIDAFAPMLAELQKRLSTAVGAINDVETQFALTDLPPMFQWPVFGPITAGYLDAAYEGVFRVPHYAIDIAVMQSTPVHAISDGVVFAVKDGGEKGYSYILIGHRNGYASLYGHVSVAFVKKGDIVNVGQTIALSGGKPGTHGAGPMTTGAHVHLEITKDGVHMDPRTVLPVR